MKIILASASPRRKELLESLKLNFSIIPAEITEELSTDLSPEENVMNLAKLKAKDIALRYPDHLVIGSDTIVVYDNKILGKPFDNKDAFRMLNLLSGKTHDVITGVSLYHNNQDETFYCKTQVTFYPLSDTEIIQYISTGEPMDKAGAYAIQGDAAKFIKSINGDYYSVIGLPIAEIYQRLKKYNTL